MFTYENGILVNALISSIYSILLIVVINSTASRNLRHLGERYSWVDFSIKPMSESDFNRTPLKSAGKYFFVIALQIPTIFLSWLNVFLVALLTAYKLYKDAGAPNSVKDFRWKIRNIEMSFDEMVQALLEARGLKSEDFQTLRAEIIRTVKERNGNQRKQEEADEYEFNQYQQEIQALRELYDPENTWSESTTPPEEYGRKLRRINVDHMEMLKRRNNWTDDDFFR